MELPRFGGHLNAWDLPAGVRARGRLILEGWQAWAAERHRPEDGFPGLPYVSRLCPTPG